MLYRSKIARVRWPEISIATRSGTPARIMLRMAVRRRSWKAKLTFAFRSARPHVVEKLPTWRPRPLWKIRGELSRAP
jgi:hypothetical protein